MAFHVFREAVCASSGVDVELALSVMSLQEGVVRDNILTMSYGIFIPPAFQDITAIIIQYLSLK